MTGESRSCYSIGELADYWTADVPVAEAEQIEAHVFACAACARLLAEAELLRRNIGSLARSGGFQAFVNDGLLNQLARDGVRVRSYSLEAGGSVQCAVWSEDEVIAARLRGDFRGVTSLEAVMRLSTGEEWFRASDVPVRDGASELVLAIPAAVVRNAPATTIHLTLRAPGSGDGSFVAEYVFDHRGAIDRVIPSRAGTMTKRTDP
jgi:hypothetical protein